MTKTPFKLGGIKQLMSNQLVIPVGVSEPAGLSDKAHEIHTWLRSEYEQHCQPILVRDVIRRFGVRTRKFAPIEFTMVLDGFPLEELLDNSLLYVDEGAE